MSETEHPDDRTEDGRAQILENRATAMDDRALAMDDRALAIDDVMASDRSQADVDRSQADTDRSQADVDRSQADTDRSQATDDRAQAVDDRAQAVDDRKASQDSLALVANSISLLNSTMTELLGRLPVVEAKAEKTRRSVSAMAVLLIIVLLIGATNFYNGFVARAQSDKIEAQGVEITSLAEQIKDCTDIAGHCYQENRHTTSSAVTSIVDAQSAKVDGALAQVLSELHEEQRQQMIVNCALLKSNGVDLVTVPPCANL